MDLIINYATINNVNILSEIYDIPLPENLSSEEKLNFFIDQIEGYEKVIDRKYEVIFNFGTNNFDIYTNGEIRNFLNVQDIYDRKELYDYTEKQFMNESFLDFKSENFIKTANDLIDYLNLYLKDDYEGLLADVEEVTDRQYLSTIVYKTRVDISQAKTLKLPTTDLSKYSGNYNGLKNFLHGMNFFESKEVNYKNPSCYRIEGGSDDAYFNIFDDIFEKYNISPNNIMEIGYNAGYSAIYFLNKFKNANLLSLDLNLHEYCFASKLFIDYHYPGRHMYIAGDSFVQLDSLKIFSETKFDLIFVDGGHDLQTAYYDLVKSAEFATKDTYLILDNISPHKGHGIGPYIAMNKSVKEGRLQFIDYYQVGEEGFCLLKYSKEQSNPIDYKNIERELPLWRLDHLCNIYLKKYNPTDDEYYSIVKIVSLFIDNDLAVDKKWTLPKLEKIQVDKALLAKLKIIR